MATEISVETRKVLVVGATGKQGRAFIRSLIFSPPNHNAASSTAEAPVNWQVLALTRNPSAAAAQALLDEADRHNAKERVTLVGADIDSSDSVRAVFEQAGKIWGVFMVLPYPGLGAPPTENEVTQGKMIAKLAHEFGVELFMYSSAITVSAKVDSYRDHSRRQKREVELYIENDLGPLGLPWIIIRPGFFFENLEGFQGSIGVTLYRDGLKEDTTIAMIASDDIGRLVAGLFNNHKPYVHKHFNVTSGPVTMHEVIEAHQRATGKPMPAVPSVVGWFVRTMNRGIQNLMEESEINHRARVSGDLATFDEDMELAKSICHLRSYEEWKRDQLKEEKDAQKELDDNSRGWNNVSLVKIFTGRS
ncbi:hypothetical protein QBC42DRAFT_203474 [Cladorrhinum samala]|uniref:NmrA-like domain-containing protein n=1 Tax=Cladorrhinum samala TaxID=585594 RepID=A0AAV9HL80_9PEZI|nr:hypothetical protein QBC42DRAFT_203474 [Cladorrhinum samala]